MRQAAPDRVPPRARADGRSALSQFLQLWAVQQTHTQAEQASRHDTGTVSPCILARRGAQQQAPAAAGVCALAAGTVRQSRQAGCDPLAHGSGCMRRLLRVFGLSRRAHGSSFRCLPSRAAPDALGRICSRCCGPALRHSRSSLHLQHPAAAVAAQALASQHAVPTCCLGIKLRGLAARRTLSRTPHAGGWTRSATRARSSPTARSAWSSSPASRCWRCTTLAAPSGSPCACRSSPRVRSPPSPPPPPAPPPRGWQGLVPGLRHLPAQPWRVAAVQ